tara:strand:- start:205 stop:432 length:228 start_codon:yes stop_codon:yes gene_type:complete
MQYARQTQDALDRLDQSLSVLHQMVKRGETAKAIQYMDAGDLKERFGDLQNLISLSTTNAGPNLGASGVSNLRTL